MFWLKFGLIAIIVYVLSYTVKLLLRKIFKIEKVKRNFFSYNHINDSHRKVDNWVRTITGITLMILAILVINSKDLTYLYLIGVITLLTLDYAVRAFFEIKCSEYPKQAILTLAEMFLVVMAILIVFKYWIA